VISCWGDGGSEPIYVCESHAKQLGRSRQHSSDIRIIIVQSGLGSDPIRTEDQIQIQEVTDTKPNPTAASEAAPTLSDRKVATAPIAPSVRAPLRDLTYGNAAKAMVDEVIWNMAAGNYQVYRAALQQGKSAEEASQAAGGQLAVVHRKISDYKPKLEAVLAESKATIDVAETIDKPLEQALLEIISNGAMSDLEKDSTIQQLGALQESVKNGLQGDISPLQANRITLAIGDRLNWGGTSNASEEIKAVYRTLYSSLKTAIFTAVPEAQNLHDRLTNLYAAKSDLENC
jgi:hypothetical protein